MNVLEMAKVEMKSPGFCATPCPYCLERFAIKIRDIALAEYDAQIASQVADIRLQVRELAEEMHY